MKPYPLSIVVSVVACTNAFLFHDKVCYHDVGCFHSDHPFDNALGELPDSPDEVQVQTFLWTKQNPVEPQVLNYRNITSIKTSSFDSSRPTKILIHGFMSSKKESPVVANLSVAFLKKNDFNVIGVDWSKGAAKFYPKAAANTRLVAAEVANLLKTLIKQFELKVENLHILGHSLGAHVSGYIGTRIPGIARITGLDPAGPLFTKYDPLVRLDPSDAVFVDVIHSDGAPLEDAGFGTLQAMGNVDFYPNGGQQQPGCPPPIKTTVEQLLELQFNAAFTSVSCAHDRAIWYFIESVLHPQCDFTSYPCTSWTDFLQDHCNSTCTDITCPAMGINSIKYQNSVKGKYFLRTTSESPFCPKDSQVVG